MIAGVCFTQRRARQRTHRDPERSDHSSVRGLLVCWLCTRWHFSLRRERRRQTAQLGLACLRAGQAISAHFIVKRKKNPPWKQSGFTNLFYQADWEHVFLSNWVICNFHSYLAIKVFKTRHMWVLCQLWSPAFVDGAVMTGLLVFSWGKSEGYLLISGPLIGVIEEERVQRGLKEKGWEPKGQGWVEGSMWVTSQSPGYSGGHPEVAFSQDHHWVRWDTETDLFRLCLRIVSSFSFVSLCFFFKVLR